jgi:mono/diheme cytochrome c family protein
MQRAHRFLAAVISITAAGCTPEDATVGNDAVESGTQYADQGWTPENRGDMYYATQGSQLLPFRWFKALRVAGSDERFASAAHMAKLGFATEPVSGENPDGLPPGFAVDGDSIGLTCTACHTGQVRYRGATVRIDGGSSLVNLMEFQKRLVASLDATLPPSARFDAFAKEVLGDKSRDPIESARLGADIAKVVLQMEMRLAPSRDAVEAGAGRIDGVGQATNETLCLEFGIPENCAPYHAPTNPGFLWGLGDLSWVQSNGSVHGALPRNVGEALGVFTPHELTPDGKPSSQVPLFNLAALEEGFEQLRAPSWNAEPLRSILPELDGDAVARGKTIFQAECASCHASRSEGPFTEPNAFGKRFVTVPVTPLEEIGTDPGFVLDLLGGTALPPPAYVTFKGSTYLEKFGTTDPKVPVPSAVLRAMIIGDVIAAFLAQNQIAPGSPEYARLFAYRETGVVRPPAEVRGYRAQPLEGIAFTGPFLHNGSVRTLADLLLPASQREPTFYVGGTELDPERVGFVTDPSEPNAYFFDTTLEGNHNSGHEYGTTLDDAKRRDLLAYLKSL